MATAPAQAQRVDPITKVLGNFGKWQLTAMLIGTSQFSFNILILFIIQ